LCRVLEYLNQKDKPYWYIDTHAGAGGYELDRGYAAMNAEYRAGIGRLWDRGDLPPGVAAYVAQVRKLNPDGPLTMYPGSPLVALGLLRPGDRLRLFELHSTDFPILEKHLTEARKRAKLFHGDGFGGLKGLLPPETRRAVTLIDPSYEMKTDYERVAKCLEDALRRFATGVYLVWHPILEREESRELPAVLKGLPLKRWLHVTLSVQSPREDGLGMSGSGLFVVNPPWTLRGELERELPWLRGVLKLDDGAGFTLDGLED
jgi:23S rRNA (adenine2030-N6)-methyltransferase